jgi:Squalene-hopene cyclase C-terminal domain/Prenyltransferase and squalene oxidase repeat
VRVAALAAVAMVAASHGASGVRYLQSHQLASGGFAEPGQAAYPQLTAWATLGIRAANGSPGSSASRYLEQHEAELSSATDLALAAMAETALAQQPDRILTRLRALERPNGSIGRLVNGTAWAVLALRADGRPVGRQTVRWLLARQAPSGCWGWTRGAVDSNDTAAVVEALRSVNIRGRQIRRALRCLASYRNGDGGFELVRGRGSDAQSTAWAVQAFLAAGRQPPRGALAYLRRLRRPDGSFRYSARYVATPVGVTSQVLPALARRPFPLRD